MKHDKNLNRLGAENQNTSKTLKRGTILCSFMVKNHKTFGKFNIAVILAVIGLACLSGCATAEGRKQIQTDVWRLVEADDVRGFEEYNNSLWKISKWDGKETWESEECGKKTTRGTRETRDC